MLLHYLWVCSRRAAAAGLFVTIGGCTAGMDAAVQSLRQVLPGGHTADAAPLDPKFSYLRVTRGSHTGLLWLGSTERSPSGPIEVYYSSAGEVVRLKNGRIIGALGLTTEWRQVSVQAPAWSAVTASAQPASVTRVRDVMPGYRSGVRDPLLLRVIPVPERAGLRGLDRNALTWFEERMQAASGGVLGPSRTEILPAARYAVDLTDGKETVVYAEQCLAPDLCFTWQRWSAAMQQAATSGR